MDALFQPQFGAGGALFELQFYAQGDAVATIIGVSATASVATIIAAGALNAVSLLLPDTIVCKVVRDYIMSIVPTQRVIRTPVNRASMPKGPYVSFTPGLRRPLATNVSAPMIGGRIVTRSEQMSFQIDCYGEGAGDTAETLNVLYRDPYAAELFQESGYDVAPLYATDIQQAPFVSGEDQYEDRYTFEIELQINSRVTVPLQSCNILGIDLISVDANFPPTEE
jgi:hypothetical protein